ncbi:Phage-related protein [[Ruminococcus] torques]|nr:Phage-related protein [[Ruminococcus] torques]
MDIFSLVGKITINYADAVNNIEKVSKSAKDTADSLGNVDKSAEKSEKSTKKLGKSTADTGNKVQQSGKSYENWRRVISSTNSVVDKAGEKCGKIGEKILESGNETEKSGSKIISIFKKISSTIVSSFKHEPIEKVGTSLKELSETVTKQETQLDALKKKYQDLYLSQGKNSDEAKACAKEIEKLSTELQDNKEKLSTASDAADKFDKSMQDVEESTEKANDGFTIWKGTLANLASTAITKVISGCTQLAEKITDVTKSAVSHYAEYEQLVGGVETLFKDSSGKLIGYAKKAYKTAGMSSNQYMNTATSFAASLIQGLGGDTAKAVELTNLAITDMSDNANKMGTDIGSIQDAYQGFAKQNYTMLDNLKLGYGGTQSEMIRLINDSGVLGEKIESLDNVTFDQMIEAIHKIQDNLGITGTTALEAGTTISGSWSSVQALFENILTKVGSKLAPTVMGFLQQLSDWMETVDWDAFATSVGDALQRVFDWIQKIDFTTFFEKGMDGVENFLEKLGGLIEDVPKIIQTFKDWSPLIAGVAAGFVTLKVAMAISSLIDAISKSWNAYKKSEEGATIAQWLFNAALNANPIVLIVTLVAGLVVALITLWNTNDGFREAVTNAWENIKTTISEKIDAIKETVINVFTAIADVVSAVWETIKDAVQVAIMFIGEIISAAFQIITMPWMFIWENCKEYIIAAWEFIKNAVSTALDVISTTISNIWNAIKSVISTVLNAISVVVSSVLNNIKSAFTSAWNSIKSTVSNVINGVKSTISSGLNAAKSTVSNVLGAIKEKFSSIFEGAKNIVSNAINRIKSFFNFSWSLPHLKLPHISISGSFNLTPPSVPHFGIEWYKKAMDDGMIMNQPTIFGYNAKSNQFLAGGEAGSETVVGTQNLMDMIQEAVNNARSGSGDSEATRALLEAIFNWMRNGGLYKLLIDVLTNGVEFEFDNREIARLVKKYA